jgi:hypothetical protein
VDAGVIVTTAVETSRGFEEKPAALEAEPSMDVRIIALDELVELLMTHLGKNRELWLIAQPWSSPGEAGAWRVRVALCSASW